MNLNFENIYLARDPIDFRCGTNTLCALIADRFGMNPADKSLYIFTNHRRDRIKCIYYDGTGFWMFYKILNEGHFNWDIDGSDTVSITPVQLDWLLAGLNIYTGTVFKEYAPKYY